MTDQKTKKVGRSRPAAPVRAVYERPEVVTEERLIQDVLVSESK